MLLILLLAGWGGIGIAGVTDTSTIDTTVVGYFKGAGVPIDSCSYYGLYEELCGWIEVPYKYASSNKTGTDCSGLVKNVYDHVYNMKIGGSSHDLYKVCEPISKDQLEEGDLVFFKIRRNTISHVGIYLRNDKFIHATTKRGVMVSDLKESYYTRYYFGGGRLNYAASE